MHKTRRTLCFPPAMSLSKRLSPPTPPLPLPPILRLPRELLTKCLEYALYTSDMHRRKPVALRHRNTLLFLPRRFSLAYAQHRAEDFYFPQGGRAVLFVCREFRLISLELYYSMTYFLFSSDAHLRSFNRGIRLDLSHRLQHLVLDHAIFIRIRPCVQKCHLMRQSGVIDYAALTQFPILRDVHFRVSVAVDPAFADAFTSITAALDQLLRSATLRLPEVIHMADYPASVPWPTHCVTHASEGKPASLFWEWNEKYAVCREMCERCEFSGVLGKKDGEGKKCRCGENEDPLASWSFSMGDL
jgi:hypothetical protein